MGDVDINWFAAVLAGVTGAVVSWVWFSRYLFRNRWALLAGLTQSRMEQGTPIAAAVTGVVSILTAYVLAYVASLIEANTGDGDLASALGAAFWLWLGISATSAIVHDAFEQRPMQVTVIATGERLVTMLVMCLIICLFGV